MPEWAQLSALATWHACLAEAQLGGGGKRDKRGRVMSMPARPYLGADERMRGKLLAAAQEWLPVALWPVWLV